MPLCLMSYMKNKISITEKVQAITISAAQILEVIVPITTSLTQKVQEEQTLNSKPLTSAVVS